MTGGRYGYPMLLIRGELEKGKRDRLLPIAPDFAEFLAQVPPEARRGRVFRPAARNPKRPTPLRHRVGEIIGEIGREAGVVVDADPRTGKAPTTYAGRSDSVGPIAYRRRR